MFTESLLKRFFIVPPVLFSVFSAPLTTLRGSVPDTFYSPPEIIFCLLPLGRSERRGITKDATSDFPSCWIDERVI